MFENKNKDLNDNNRIDDDLMQEVSGGECQERFTPVDPSSIPIIDTGSENTDDQGMSRNENGNLHFF